MGIYVKNNRYYYKKQIEGKVYYKSLRLSRGQERFISQRIRQLEDEIIAEHFKLDGIPEKDIKFSEYKKKYKKSKSHKKSVGNDMIMLDIVEEHWHDPQLDLIRKPDIQNLEQHLLEKRKVSPTTVNRYMVLLRHFFNLAMEEGYLKSNPLDKYEFFVEDKGRRALSFEELEEIFKAAKAVQDKPAGSVQRVIYDMLALSFNTGMRLGEILNLRKEYIKDKMIVYPITSTKYRRRSASNSKRKTKIIILNEYAKKIISRQPVVGGYLFPSRRSDSVQKSIKEIREKSKITDFTFHMIRHTVSTYLSQQLPISIAQAVLGHSSVSVTERYTHPQEKEITAGVEKIGEMFKGLQA